MFLHQSTLINTQIGKTYNTTAYISGYGGMISMKATTG